MYRSNRILTLAGILTVALLGGCVQPEPVAQLPASYVGRVDQVTAEIVVSVNRATGQTTEAGRAELFNRIRNFGSPATTRAVVIDGTLSPAARASLLGLLEQAGVPRANVTFAAGDDGGTRSSAAAGVRLHLVRYAVAPAECPGWDDIQQNYLSNGPTMQLGCTNTRNLQLMVEDPHDLIVGRSLDPADGTREAGAVTRYQADKVKPLSGTTTSSISATGAR